MASVKVKSYIEAVKGKPGLLVHLGLFAVMCVLNVGVWDSLAEVLPESVELGHKAIIAETVTVFIVICMIVRASSDVAKRALVLLVATTVVTVFNFGVHWFYSRDLAMANKYVNYLNGQKVVDNNLANQQAGRVGEVLDKLTGFNKSQTALAKADQEYYKNTGQKRNRKIVSAPDLNQLGIIVNPSPTPAPSPGPMVNGLSTSTVGGTLGQEPVKEPVKKIVPLTPDEVPVKYSNWFLIGGILALAVTFIGAAYVAATWEWDWNGNGLADSKEGLTGKA